MILRTFLKKEHLEKFPNSEFNQQVQIKRVDGAIICSEFISTNIDFKGQSVSELIARDITIQQKEIENVKRLAYQDAVNRFAKSKGLHGSTHSIVEIIRRK